MVAITCANWSSFEASNKNCNGVCENQEGIGKHECADGLGNYWKCECYNWGSIELFPKWMFIISPAKVEKRKKTPYLALNQSYK